MCPPGIFASSPVAAAILPLMSTGPVVRGAPVTKAIAALTISSAIAPAGSQITPVKGCGKGTGEGDPGTTSRWRSSPTTKSSHVAAWGMENS